MPPPKGTLQRGPRSASECHCGAGHAASVTGTGMKSGLFHTQIYRGNEFWHHQTGSGIQTMSAVQLRLGPS